MQLKNAAAAEILSDIERIRCDRTLLLEKNFIARTEAIDVLEFHVIERIDALPENSNSPERMNKLMNDAMRLKFDLEGLNASLFHRLRSKISCEGLRDQRLTDLLEEYLGCPLRSFFQPETVGYDHLDLLLNGVLNFQNLPVETKGREPDMVFYQKTPARVVFELINKAAFKPDDIFFDLGSGLGQVVMLVNLFANVTSIGIEYEPTFCDYAKNVAAGLNLDKVSFINADARDSDYSTGTVFFMYTPFEGKMLRDTIQKLHREALKRKIKIFTYGPCTQVIVQEEWLIKTSGSNEEFGEFQTAGCI